MPDEHRHKALHSNTATGVLKRFMSKTIRHGLKQPIWSQSIWSQPVRSQAMVCSGELPKSEWYNAILVITVHLMRHFIPARHRCGNILYLLHPGTICRLPKQITSDRGRSLYQLFAAKSTGRLDMRLCLSSACHPQTKRLIRAKFAYNSTSCSTHPPVLYTDGNHTYSISSSNQTWLHL